MEKHILFGINASANREIEEAILAEYKNELGKKFTYNSEYYLQGIERSLSENQYDILILREDLEGISNPVTVEFLDKITDKYPVRIILIVEDEHEKDSYVKRLFNTGIYDILYKEDATIQAINELIETPRTKMRAKVYLDIDEIEDISKQDNLEDIPDDELERVLFHLSQARQDTISELFNEIDEQYNEKQMLFLLTLMSDEIIKMLSNTDNEKFKLYHKKWMIIEGKYNEVEIPDTSKPKVKEKVVVKEKVKYETKVVTKVEKQYIHSIPKDYNKIAAFIGNRKVGTTTIVDLVATSFSEKGKKVAVLDLTKNKTLFYMKCWGNEDITEEEKRGLELLNKGVDRPIQVNDNYKLYTQIGYELEKFDFFNTIEQIRYDNDVILIDMDFSTEYQWLKYGVTALYLVQDLNIMDMPQTKEHLKKLISTGVNSRKIHLIVNKKLKCKIKTNDILITLTEPIPYIEHKVKANYLDINEKVFNVDFKEDFYKEVLTSYMFVGDKINPCDNIKEQIEKISNDIYPIKTTKKEKKGFLGFLSFGK